MRFSSDSASRLCRRFVRCVGRRRFIVSARLVQRIFTQTKSNETRIDAVCAIFGRSSAMTQLVLPQLIVDRLRHGVAGIVYGDRALARCRVRVIDPNCLLQAENRE